MKTRKLAAFFSNLADFLNKKAEFDTESCVSVLEGYGDITPHVHISFYDRDKFVAAVKAIGNATKKYTDGEYPKLLIKANDFPIELTISRDKVCKKTVTFDCEPLFSEEEVRSL